MSVVYRNDHSAILTGADERAVEVLTAYPPRFQKAAPIVSLVRSRPKSHTPATFLPVNGVLVEQMRKDIRLLTNEHGTSGIVLRYSFHQGARIAVSWIKQQFEETGATCKLVSFMPNVIWLVLLT